MKKSLLISLLFAGSAAMAQNTDEAVKFAALITPKALKEKLTILAGPEMEGRETASPGQKKAAAYIEAQFKKFGLKPGNGDSYQQLYPVYQQQLTESKFTVNGKSFDWDKDFSFNLQTVSLKFSDVVFVGYGQVDSAKGINDFAGLDIKGKLVVILAGSGSGSAMNFPAGSGGQRGGFGQQSQNSPLAIARSKGALGLLTIIDFTNPNRRPAATKGRMSIALPTTNNASPAASFFTANISYEVASALFGKSPAVPFASLKEVAKGIYPADLTIAATATTVTLESSNVIGIIPGTSKKDEYVFLTGHYDHLGKTGNVIYYGADDDGSGSVGVMQMAEAFAAAAKAGYKPKRTMIFMTVSGEEKGLLGSEYYSEHPTVDLAKASADLNTDMIGRGDSSRTRLGLDSLNYIYVIGHDKLSSDLAIINEGVNKKYVNITLDYKFDDPKDQQRIYYRSDHYNFAKKGVPILFFYDGMLGADYHKPTDTVDKIQFDIMAKRAQLVFYTGWEIANRDEMLKRDMPLNMPPSR